MNDINKISVKEKFLAFVKNRQTWGFLVSVVIMAAISLAFFYPDNFNGKDLSQHDMIQGLANGQEIALYEAETGIQSRWTNSLFGGMPTFQISPDYHSDSLFRWVTTVYGLGLPSPSNLLFMMMLGFMILMIVMKIRWEYGLIGAIAWGFSTYFVIIIGAGHIWKFVTLSYIPPTIAGIMLAYRGRYLAGGAMAAFFAMMQLVSNHIQMSYYFFFVIAGIMIAYLFSLSKENKTGQWFKATGVLVIAAALAVYANLPNLYHTYKYAKESQRAGSELAVADAPSTSSEQSREYITQYSYGIDETLTLLIPNIKGGATSKPYQGSMRLLDLSELDAARDAMDRSELTEVYLTQIARPYGLSAQYFGDPESTHGPVYVGAIIFMLFVFGCVVVKGPMKWALLFLTVLSILLSWGRNFMELTDLFLDIVPMYNKFRTPESILVIAEFTMPLLAILGLCELFKDKESAKKHAKTLYLSSGICFAVCALIWIFPGILGSTMDRHVWFADQLIHSYTSQGYPIDEIMQLTVKNPEIFHAVQDIHFSMIKADSLRSMLFILLGAGALVLYCLGKLKAVISGATVGIFVLIDLYSADKRYLDHDSFDPIKTIEAKSIAPTPADNQINQDHDMNYRVLDKDRFNIANPSYFHKMLGGYHAAKLRRYDDLINTELIFQDNVYNMLNAKYIVSDGKVEINSDALGNAWFIDDISYVDNAREEFEALRDIDPSIFAVADKKFSDVLGEVTPSFERSVEETSYAPDRLTYRTTSPDDGIVVFSEIYFPWGWEATIDGKPAEIGRVNYILRALRVPAGEHEIIMTFNPHSVKTTTIAATIAVILIYLSILAAIAQRFLCPCKGGTCDE